MNPSINDYLLSELSSNANEQISIIDNTVYFEQILKVLLSREAIMHFLTKFNNENFLKLEVLENLSYFYFLKCIVNHNFFKSELTNSVKIALERAYQNLNYKAIAEYDELLNMLFTKEFFTFYKLHNIFFLKEKIYFILKPMRYDDIIEFANMLVKRYTDSMITEYVSIIKELLVEKIINRVQDELSDVLLDIVLDDIRSYEYEGSIAPIFLDNAV